MLLLWPCLLLASTHAHRVEESSEDVPAAPAPPPALAPAPANYTALFPVNGTQAQKIRGATSWKIETTFGTSKLDANSTESKENAVVERPANSSSQEFRASQQTDGPADSLEAGGGFSPPSHHGGPTPHDHGLFSNAIKRPPAGFLHSSKHVKFPKENFKPYHEFPYKIETPILTRAKDGWKPTAGTSPGLETRPTDESPVRVPAGGLYQSPDPFKVKPGTTDEDFGLEFTDGKEHRIKKPSSGLAGLARLLTALIPVGIIFSALTPALITVEPDAPVGGVYTNPHRRAGGPPPPGARAPMSERCRRRLLCELTHADNSYYRPPGAPRPPCRRRPCEDPAAVAEALEWLLSQPRPPSAGLAGDVWEHYT